VRNQRHGSGLIRVSGGGDEGGGYGVFIGEVSWQNETKIGQILRSPDPFEYGVREQILSLEVEDNLMSGSRPSEKKNKKERKRGRQGRRDCCWASRVRGR
jgi:hypothetical protein